MSFHRKDGHQEHEREESLTHHDSTSSHESHTYNHQQKNREQKSYFQWLIRFTTSALIVTVLLLGATLALFKFDLLSSPNSNATSQSSNSSNQVGNVVQTSVKSDISSAVEGVQDAVVGVVNIQQQQQGLFNSDSSQQNAGTGSGVIYKKEDGHAYIVTNHHVVEDAASVEIVLSDDTRVEAELLGSDVLTDLAVLKIDGSNVDTVASFASSDNVQVGEPAIAIGNPLGLEFSGSVTQGIISGLERTVPVDLNQDGAKDWQSEVIQTDAAINPGNSGGALININGEVIGINSMKISSSQVEGIGFAIPSAAALPIIEDLETEGKVVRPHIGIGTVNVSEVPANQLKQEINLPQDISAGVLIAEVQPNSPANQAGLQKYDTIVAIDNEEVTSLIDLRKYVYEEKNIGDSVNLTFYRDGEKQTTTLELAEEQSTKSQAVPQ
ncbi:serine protease [Pontibacillus halophilus JSM 076056 = DSM 19796]|uniref:Serine protease n=1 Tax=Pontibacillus halophilus JSM 076056 = DSM 19796 TaxID=1385510 RepID=A0A0A5GP60_9BACI|nr:S1C family serine protease [Pontibacillus halophilus]KGX93784.1 serine protease [Pontibacillus halophilus JSM 076056 = DSM 19796]